ncbi:MAG: DUF481 domain-containing protein [Bacteroidia bacterium]
MKIVALQICFICSFISAYSQVETVMSDTALIETSVSDTLISDLSVEGLATVERQFSKKEKPLGKRLEKRSFAERDSSKKQLKTYWKPRMGYNLNMSFDFARGNLNLINFLPKTDVLLEAGPFGLNTSIGYNFAQLDGQLISNDFIFDAVPVIGLGDKLHLNGIVGAQAASIRNIDHRQKTGLGFGLPFKDKTNEKVNLNINGVHEKTDYAANDSSRLIFSNGSKVLTRFTYGLQLGSNGQVQIGKGGVQLSYHTYIVKAINIKEDFRVSAFTTLLIPLGKKIFFQTNLNYTYEHIILKGTRHHDLFVSFGFGLAGKQAEESER